jgi:AP-2 complex subunit sigma-1
MCYEHALRLKKRYRRENGVSLCVFSVASRAAAVHNARARFFFTSCHRRLASGGLETCLFGRSRPLPFPRSPSPGAVRAASAFGARGARGGGRSRRARFRRSALGFRRGRRADGRLETRLLPFATMIRFLLLQNRAGKTRLAKYYVPLDDDEKHQLEREVHRVVVNRDPKHTNFVEYRAYKIIYRRYAGLFFSLCVDVNDNELALLEAVHLFVEVLDHFFGNVCELDLVFNFHKVYLIIDEFILAGEIQETSKKQIMERLGELEAVRE